jgi:hypothetical protein
MFCVSDNWKRLKHENRPGAQLLVYVVGHPNDDKTILYVSPVTFVDDAKRDDSLRGVPTLR